MTHEEMFKDRVKRWDTQALARQCDVSVSAVVRWQSGETVPRKPIMDYFLFKVDTYATLFPEELDAE